MKVRCLHGYFLFEEHSAGEISKFLQIFSDLSIVADELAGFTFETLAEAPSHVVAGDTYLGALATVTYEGKPWEIMRANGLVYNFQTDTVVAIASITKRLEISTAANYFVSPGLILPGSVTDDGERVTDYAAFFLFDQRFRYSEVLSE